MKQKIVVFGIALLIIISMSMVIKINTGATKNDDAVWAVTLDFSETSGKMDYVVFGEAPDANDGAVDSYDTPKPPPAPYPPYLRAWFDDNLPMPYNALWEDFRQHPDTEKVWDLSVQWESPSSEPIDVTISWDNNEFIDCEYDFVVLMRYDSSNEVCEFIDMLSEDYYIYMPRYSNGMWLIDHFQISCIKTETTPPNGDDPQPPSNGDSPPPGENHPPTANASASETSGFVNTLLNFSGSLSTDTDGYITNWIWDFGDDTIGNGEIVEHAYTNSGIYTATLTVTDNENATDTDTFIVQIAVGNNAPTKPQVNGIIEGHQNTEYIYTAISTDLDDDAICYFFIWGDDNTTISEFLPSGTSCFMDHEWLSAGEYEIEVYAHDNKTYSEPTQLIVLIDIFYVDDIGYLNNDDSDGIYDSFYSNATGEQTVVEKQDGTYLIDEDGDGEWDYFFDLSEGISVYTKADGQGKTPSFEIIIILSAVLLVLLFKIFWKRKR